MVASVLRTRPSTIAPNDSPYEDASIVALRSFTASQTVTTVGRCAIAPGSCSRCACRTRDPETARFVNVEPGGMRAATRAGHEPLAGSVAPMPTESDAPRAT